MRRTLLVSVISLAACGGSAPVADLATASDLGGTACTDPDPAPGSVCPLDVTGSFTRESQDTAFAERVVSVCAGLCFFGSTDTSGRFAAHVDAHILLADYAFEVHGRPDVATYYTPLPSGVGTSLAYVKPLPLPRLPSAGTPLPEDGSAQTITSGELTLSIPAGTTIQFSVEDFGVPHGHELRVRTIESPSNMPFVDGSAPPAALYALAPFEAAFSQKVALSLPNTAHLPAGAAVELQGMTGLVNDTPPAGRLRKVASAHVSADGTKVTTDAGEGLLELTWLAVRAL